MTKVATSGERVQANIKESHSMAVNESFRCFFNVFLFCLSVSCYYFL